MKMICLIQIVLAMVLSASIMFHMIALFFIAQIDETKKFGILFCASTYFDYNTFNWNMKPNIFFAVIAIVVNSVLLIRIAISTNSSENPKLRYCVMCFLCSIHTAISVAQIVFDFLLSSSFSAISSWHMFDIKTCNKVPGFLIHNVTNNYNRLLCVMVQTVVSFMLTTGIYIVENLIQQKEEEEALRQRVEQLRSFDHLLSPQVPSIYGRRHLETPPPAYQDCVDTSEQRDGPRDDIEMQDLNGNYTPTSSLASTDLNIADIWRVSTPDTEPTFDVTAREIFKLSAELEKSDNQSEMSDETIKPGVQNTSVFPHSDVSCHSLDNDNCSESMEISKSVDFRSTSLPHLHTAVSIEDSDDVSQKTVLTSGWLTESDWKKTATGNTLSSIPLAPLSSHSKYLRFAVSCPSLFTGTGNDAAAPISSNTELRQSRQSLLSDSSYHTAISMTDSLDEYHDAITGSDDHNNNAFIPE